MLEIRMAGRWTKSRTATTGIPRYRTSTGPALLQHGFRPFFLLAGVWSAAALALWTGTLGGWLMLPSGFDLVMWHAHEMLFGFGVAAVAGFLLTAVPNWTGSMPLQGLPLAGLVAAWAAGRVAVAWSLPIGPGPAALLDLAFLTILLGAIAREIVAGRNWRNLPVCLALSALLLANGLTHLEAVAGAPTGAAGLRLGIAVLIALITLVGGRIVPSFTTNWLKKQGDTALPVPFGTFDKGVLVVTVAALLGWVVAPASAVAGALLLAAGGGNAVRLARWRGHRTGAEPLVWILHLGYAWVPAGLALVALALLAPQIVAASAGVHALTAGAIGTMTLAVMTRATLGHTGQTLHAGPGTVLIYACITIGAVLRVAAPFFFASVDLLLASAAFWGGAFVLFVSLYGPLLVRPRPR